MSDGSVRTSNVSCPGVWHTVVSESDGRVREFYVRTDSMQSFPLFNQEREPRFLLQSQREERRCLPPQKNFEGVVIVFSIVELILGLGDT